MAQVCIVKSTGERICSPDSPMPLKSRGKAKGRCTFYHPVGGPPEFIRDTGKHLNDEEIVPELVRDARARDWKDNECHLEVGGVPVATAAH